MTTRIHALQAVENFRDYGDYASRHGGRVAHGRLFRSAHHAMATDTDLDAMAALGIGALVDLRRPRERDAQPSRRPAGFAGAVIQCDLGDQAEAPHLAFLRDTDLSPGSVRNFYLDYYAKAPFEPRHGILFRQYFEALDEQDGAVLIHCTAGKDRTGLLAALTHHILGVDEADIEADYLLTNAAARMEERLPMVAAALEQSTGKVPSDTAVRAFLGVDAQFLAAGFAAIAERCGSTDAYLDAIGVDGARRDRIAEKLLT
jgi:protein-tyrosine phosphatase